LLLRFLLLGILQYRFSKLCWYRWILPFLLLLLQQCGAMCLLLLLLLLGLRRLLLLLLLGLRLPQRGAMCLL
jgi:hypothetical protein